MRTHTLNYLTQLHRLAAQAARLARRDTRHRAIATAFDRLARRHAGRQAGTRYVH